MKATEKELMELKSRIAKANAEMGLSRSDIGKLTGVDASQVSRICRGQFKTISHNVVQVCKAVGLKAPVAEPVSSTDIEWLKVEASARRLWEKSDRNSDRITKLFEAIGDIGQH